MALALRIQANQLRGQIQKRMPSSAQIARSTAEALEAIQDYLDHLRIGVQTNTEMIDSGTTSSSTDFTYVGRIVLPGTQSVAADVLANRYQVAARNGVTLSDVAVSAKTAAASSSFIADVSRSSDGGSTWASLFPSGSANKIVLPVSKAEVTLNPTWAIATLALGDLVSVDVVQADGTAAGIEILLRGFRN